MRELELSTALQRGASGQDVKRVQEWLTLHGFGLQLDGAFGPATEAAVRAFQRAQQLPPDGIVTPALHAQLVAPMRRALAPIEPHGQELGALTVAFARQHLAQAPREVGGDNRGPWVRLYMAGNEGRSWRWCAGFACFCLKQACEALQIAPPLKLSFSCDVLGESASQRGSLLRAELPDLPRALRPGFLFLQRRTPDDWIHVGIVSEVEREWFSTVEGNTDDGGSANGHEVAARSRGYAGRDFIRIG